jgi:cyanosortase A-associated protein
MTIQIPRLARQSWLLLLCGGAIGVLGNAIVNNPTKSSLRAPTAFEFPQTVPLPELQLLDSKQLTPHTFKNKMVANGRQYRYQSNLQPNTPIEIEVRYITDGVAIKPTVDGLLPILTKVPAAAITPATMKQQPKLGYYSLFVEQEKAYFSTCINPQGITTVTGDQFHTNSNPNPLSGIPVERFLPWLLGQQTLRDSRCVWTVLSTPIDRASPDATMKTLETIGVNWIRWWQLHFPAA